VIPLPFISVAPGGTLVSCSHSQTTACANPNPQLVFDGNDAIVLRCGAVVDAIGQIGNAATWGANVDLRRVCLPGGDPVATDAFLLAEEWTTHAAQPIDYSDLGTPPSCPATP
jgi:hypothetical protein